MNYIKITKNDIANGEGVRVVLWLSGCSHNCKGCHNPQTHNPNSGALFDRKARKELLKALDNEWISGITLSGGDPLNRNNLHDTLNLIEEIKQSFPNKTMWIYTGYTWEQIMEPNCVKCNKGNSIQEWVCNEVDEFLRGLRQSIVSKCDVLVDGRYEEDKRDITLRWRGSSNQRVIDVQQSIKDNKVVLYTR